MKQPGKKCSQAWKSLAFSVLLVFLCLLTSGCWDRREIQDRSFVLAAAIDLVPQPTPDQAAEKNLVNELDPNVKGPNRLQYSVQLLRLMPKGGGEESSKPGGGKTYVLSTAAPTVFEAIRTLLGQNSKPLWFEHMQAIFISEQVLEEVGIDRIIDLFRRDSEMRWNMRIFVTRASAKALLEYEPLTGEPGGIFFTGLSRNVAKDPFLATAGINLGYVARSIDLNSDFVLPRIEMKGKDIKLTGMAMFHKARFAGYVNDYAIKGIKLLRGLEKSALITTECPDHPGHYITFELFRHHTVLSPHVDGDNIFFTADIAMRGNMGEGGCAHLHRPDDLDLISRQTAAFSSEVERNIQYGVEECQRIGVDDLQFSAYLKAYKPKVWAKVKDDWETIFPQIPVYVSVRISIMNVGEHQ